MWLDASVGKEKLPVGNFMFSVLMRPDIRPGLALFFEQMGKLTQVVLVAQRVFARQGDSAPILRCREHLQLSSGCLVHH